MRLIIVVLLLAVSVLAQRLPAPAKPSVRVPKVGEWLIRKVEVEGQRKLEKDAILDRIQSKKGQIYRDSQIREDVLSLFKLGYFNDVQVDRKVEGQQVDLTFKVLEKPAITEIVYEGNADLKTEELTEAAGLKAFEMVNMSKIKEATEKIQK